MTSASPAPARTCRANNSGTVTALANRFVWITNYKLLGADYGMEAIVPVMRTSLTLNAAGISDSRTGVGDIYLGLAGAGRMARSGTLRPPPACGWTTAAPATRPARQGLAKSTMLTGGLTYHFDAAKPSPPRPWPATNSTARTTRAFATAIK